MEPNKTINPRDVFQSIPLKEMDSAALTITLMNGVIETHALGDAARIMDALQIATYLHIEQRRKNRQGMPITPYIEHPLRNTIRLHRMGCYDTDILIAALLHDTVEDCAVRIVRDYCGEDPDSMTLDELRERCYTWLTERFNARVATTVRNVTNPPLPKGLTKPEKQELYREHVRAVITLDEDTFLVKFSDFDDNASSLPYNNTPENKGMVVSMAKKYLPLVEAFRVQSEAFDLPVSKQGRITIRGKLVSIEQKLGELLAEHA